MFKYEIGYKFKSKGNHCYEVINRYIADGEEVYDLVDECDRKYWGICTVTIDAVALPKTELELFLETLCLK